ncbi:hypothetical protein GS909_23550 [Rhodococcus hoagii]|nr:hypothetical protein [Prescottella equi]
MSCFPEAVPTILVSQLLASGLTQLFHVGALQTGKQLALHSLSYITHCLSRARITSDPDAGLAEVGAQSKSSGLVELEHWSIEMNTRKYVPGEDDR